MSTRWDSFNSRLLNNLHKKWHGPFYVKFLEGLSTFKQQKDLRQTALALFPKSEREIAPPTPQAIKHFGTGNVGRDQQVIMFLDQAVNWGIQEILGGNAQGVSQAFYKLFSELGLPFDTLLNALEKPSNYPALRDLFLHPTLRRYGTLLMILLDVSSLTPDKNPLHISLETVEDLAFFGCLSLIDALFIKQDGIYSKTPFTAISPQNLPPQQNLNYMGIDDALLDEIYEQGKASYAPTAIQEVIAVNKGMYALERKDPKLQEILPAVLSSSSFLWEEDLFDIDAEEVEAMTDEERILTLVDKKSAILERCFDHLKNKVTWHGSHLFMTLDRKNALIAQGREVAGLLDLRASKREPLEYWGQKERALRQAFLSLAEERGFSEREAAIGLLDIVSKRSLPVLAPESPNAPLLRVLREYQNALIEKAKVKEAVTKIGEKLQKEREDLEGKFYAILKNVEQNYLEEFTNEIELIKVYATFSFILLNKDLFPPISLKKETQKKAVRKMAALKEKWKKKSAFQAMKEKPLEPGEILSQDGVFQAVINKQVERVYRSYQPQSASYKIKPLSEEDVEKLASAAKNIQKNAQQGKKEAARQFLKLESLLENILVEDHAFLSTLDRVQRLNPQRAASLQAHMEAALLFAGDKESKSISNSQGFQKLQAAIVDSLTDKGIKEKIEKSSQNILKQAQELTLPVKKDTLQQVLSKDLVGHTYDELKDKKLEVEAVPQEDSHEVKELEKASAALVAYFEEQLYGEGLMGLMTYSSPEVFFQKLPPKTRRHLFGTLNFMQTKPFKDLNSYSKFFISDLIAFNRVPKTERSLIESFRRFFQENKFKTAPFEIKKKGIIQKALENNLEKDRELVLLPWFANQIKDEIARRKESSKKYALVADAGPLDIERQIDVFSNKTLFQFFDRKKDQCSEEANRASGAYYDFLPIFIASFLNTQDLFQEQREELQEIKMQFIEQMPGARIIHEKLKEYLAQNSAGLRKLQDWLKEETTKNADRLRDNPEEVGAFIGEMLQEGKRRVSEWFPIGQYFEEAKSWALLSSLICGGLLVAFSGLGFGGVTLLIGTVLLSCVGAVFLQRGALPFLKTLFNTVWEKIKAAFETEEYKEGAPSELLLSIFKAALSNELTAFDKFEEMEHRLNYSFYIQELFEVMNHSQSNLLSFRERINALIPNATREANFSVMALNMFCMLNKNLFFIVPSEILQDASHPRFLPSIEEYLSAYKGALSFISEGFQGEKDLSYEHETPYSRFLKDHAEKRHIKLRFSPFSNIGKLSGNKEVEFEIPPDKIIPFEKINPKQTASNIKAFLQTTKELSQRRGRFEHELRGVLQRADLSLKQPLSPKNEQQALSLISCFEIVRYSFSLSKSWENMRRSDYETEFSRWLKATEESPTSIFSSHLFNTALSSLRKTAEFAASLDLPEGTALLRLVKEVGYHQKTFLETGMLAYPAFSVWEELKNNLFHLLKNQLPLHPMIAYPMLVEFEVNKGLFLPLIVWNGFKQALSNAYGEESTEIVPLLNSSKILYLTNMEEMVLFSTPEIRGFALSPFVVEAMQDVIHRFSNRELSQFLGRLSTKVQELEAVERRPLRYRIPFMQPLKRIREGASPGKEQPLIPANQNWVQPRTASSKINPKVGLAPMHYDPDNLGLSPEDAYRYYGERLPEGIRNQMRSKLEEQPKGMPLQSALSSGQNLISSQSSQPSQQNIPGLLPYMQPNIEGPIEMKEQENVEMMENPIEIGVNAEGKSISMGGGGQNMPYDAEGSFGRIWPEIESGNRRIEEMGQGKSFPNAPNQPYFNPMNQQYDPVIQENPFPWGKVAAIGGGAALGAGLLGYLMSDKNKKKERK
jgi:hypothetical protein